MDTYILLLFIVMGLLIVDYIVYRTNKKNYEYIINNERYNKK